jgi:isopenicillin-N N-acyltransferase-like protein
VPGLVRRHPKKLCALAIALVLPAIAHFSIKLGTPILPPSVSLSRADATGDLDQGTRRLGEGYARRRGKIIEVRLAGAPEDIGHEMGRMLYPQMVKNEGELLADFEKYVPIPPARWLIMDVSRLQFRHVDEGMPDARRREIAAQAAAFSPDPFASLLPTYHRFVFLQSLYDIALSFEHSPLIGCTSFSIGGEASADGHVLLARNFDFEAGTIFDIGKAIFLIEETGQIPYASVSWPGLAGVVSGMNAEGVALVVHGARAKEPRSVGEPVVHTMREVLGQAKSTAEAVAMLAKKSAMVSHLVMIVDPSGDVAIVERVPGEEPFVRRGKGKVPLTNHLEGPFANDPANKRVEANTSTWPRRKRLDELLAALRPGATIDEAIAILRDKKGVSGAELALGDRRAIDALIATHAVVFDTTARAVWVSEGPHLVGRFVKFDVGKLLAKGYEPDMAEPLVTAPEDPIRASGAYDAWIKDGSKHRGER